VNGGALVAAAVLCSALLHAGWNTAAKSIGDRWAASALMGCAYGGIGLVAVLILPLPGAAAVPFVAASVLLQVGYLLLLTSAYQHGDMSGLYPLIRGLAPLLVTAVSVAVLHEHLTGWALAGVAVLCVALLTLAFAHGRPRRGHGIGLAVATGCCIAAYSLVDGVGVRHSDHVLGYAAWLFFLQGPLLVGICWWRGGADFAGRLRRHAGKGLTGGAVSLVVYAVVVWAQSRAPLPVVSALRETSVVWAVFAGRLLLNERLTGRAVAATALAAAGAIVVELTA